MQKNRLLVFGLLVLVWISAFLALPVLPEKMAVHWNAAGLADGQADKTFGTFFIPALMLLMVGLFAWLPSTDPLLRKPDEKTRRAYSMVLLGLVLFFAYLQCLVLGWNLGYLSSFSLVVFLAPGFAALFWFLGIAMENIERNWIMGIRTPWTMSDETVWKKTHEKAALVFKLVAVCSLSGIVFQSIAFLLVVVPAVLGGLGLAAYSYLEYRKLHP